MADANRSISRWSLATRSTAASIQTIPLVNVRRKLLRPNTSNQRTIPQRDNRGKTDIQELFKLYYSNDLQFDGLQRQIVTGKRIHANLKKTHPLDESSNNAFTAKIFVSREQINPCDVNKTDEQNPVEPTLKKNLLKADHRPVHSSTLTDSPSRCKTASVHRVPRENSPISPSEDFCEPSFVKSVTFFDDPVPEPVETDEYQPKFEVFRRPLSSSKSSFYTTIPRPPQSSMLFNQPARSTGMRTPVSRSTRASTRSGMVTSTTLSPRYRSAARKRVESNHRIKSSTSRTTESTAKQVTIISGLSIPIENKAIRMNSMLNMLTTPSSTSPTPFTANQDDLFPKNELNQRIVSIPSKCSRYVLVSFPEVPVRYNAPSYVERLLLQERFPKLFENIVRSYDHRSRSAPNHQHASK